MIVCPLLVGGEVIGTLNLARMGERGGALQPGRVRARPAVRGPGVDRAAQRRGARGGHHQGRARRADRPPQPRRVPAGARRPSSSASGRSRLLMLDLDAFKAYNDTHGHPEGDALLARVARGDDGRRSAPRTGVYRYGGDEFAIILPGVSATEAREVGERIRTAVARLTDTFGPLVTVSVGVATFPKDALDEGRPGRRSRTARCTSPSRRTACAAPPTTRPATCTSPRSTRRRSSSSSASSRASCSTRSSSAPRASSA